MTRDSDISQAVFLGGSYVWAITTSFPNGWPAVTVPKQLEVRLRRAYVRVIRRGLCPVKPSSLGNPRPTNPYIFSPSLSAIY